MKIKVLSLVLDNHDRDCYFIVSSENTSFGDLQRFAKLYSNQEQEKIRFQIYGTKLWIYEDASILLDEIEELEDKMVLRVVNQLREDDLPFPLCPRSLVIVKKNNGDVARHPVRICECGSVRGWANSVGDFVAQRDGIPRSRQLAEINGQFYLPGAYWGLLKCPTTIKIYEATSGNQN